MRFFYLLWLSILWLNMDKSLQQNEITCDLKRFQHADIDRSKSEYKSQYKFNEQVEYVCKDGYEGRFTLTCGETDWIGRPQCTGRRCEKPDISNSYIIRNDKESYSHGERVQYTCRNENDRQFTITCEQGVWTGIQSCEEITCNLKPFQHADIDRSKSEYKSQYKYNEQVEYVCKDGYEGRFTLTCGETDWIGSTQCTGSRCEKLDISDAYIIRNDKESYSHGERVRYTCRNENDRQFTITCEQGVWTGIQSCEDNTTCPKVEVEHGFTVELKGTMYYACKDGFKPVTKGWWREVKCNNHTWSEIPTCIENKSCGEMPVIPNMESEHLVNGKQTVQIICKEGYRAQVDHLTCQMGNWHGGGFPLKDICKPVEKHCKPPIKVENAVVESAYQKEYLSGSEVTYRCHNNYTMEGEGTIKCTNGKWEKKDIKCTQLLGCGTPPLLADGDVKYTMKSQYSLNERVEYMCQNYYTMEGEPYRTCISGEWTGQMRCLKPCTLNEDDSRQHNITLTFSDNKYFLHDEIIEFRCTRGVPVGDMAMRQRCNGGVVLLPTCQ